MINNDIYKDKYEFLKQHVEHTYGADTMKHIEYLWSRNNTDRILEIHERDAFEKQRMKEYAIAY